MVSDLKPFDVITSPYRDLTGQLKTNPDGTIQAGIFMVLFAEESGNFTCVKITSQDTKYINGFSYTLPKTLHPFLRASSHVQLDRLHTLNYSTCNKIGEIEESCRLPICKRYEAYMHLIRVELYKYLPRKYISPNSRTKKAILVEGDDYDTEFFNITHKGI